MAVRKARCIREPMQKSIHVKHISSKQVNEKDKKAIVIAQEIKFARLLSCNDKVTRDRVLKNLKRWLIVRSQSTLGKICILVFVFLFPIPINSDFCLSKFIYLNFIYLFIRYIIRKRYT